MAKAAIEQSEIFAKVAEHLNQNLFDGKLTECMYVFSRNKNIIGGYFAPEKWENDNRIKIP